MSAERHIEPGGAFTLRLPTHKALVTLRLEVPARSMRLADFVPLAQMLTDLLVDHAIQVDTRKNDVEVTCRAGCGACCRQLVPVSAPEAFRLAQHVKDIAAPSRDELLERYRRAERTIDERGMLGRLEPLPPPSRKAELSVLAAEYFTLVLSCPFLVEERCGIYAERPLSCRNYNVTTAALRCGDPTLFPIRLVPTPPHLTGPLARMTATLAGGEPELIPLSLALRWVDAHADLGSREWPAAQLFETFLDEAGL